eukprot:4032269-Amphidinium_carterae.1
MKGGRPPSGRRLAGGTCESALTKHVEVVSPLSITSKKPEWQIVVGLNLAAKATRFPLTCANRFSSLDPEKDFEDEEFYSASSDVDGDSAAESAEATQLSSKGREQVVSCSQGGVLGLPEQLSVCPSDLESPEGEVSGVLQRRSGGTRAAHPSCQVDSVLSDKELHVPFFDDELWLAGKDAEGGTHNSNKVAALRED